jgi:hypothetical protein
MRTSPAHPHAVHTVPVASLLALTLGSVLCLGAQEPRSTRNGRRVLLPRDEEIALARTAAPPSVSGHARILVLTDTGYAVAVPGTTGVTCVVNRSWRDSREPQCYDAEGSATIFPIETRWACPGLVDTRFMDGTCGSETVNGQQQRAYSYPCLDDDRPSEAIVGGRCSRRRYATASRTSRS